MTCSKTVISDTESFLPIKSTSVGDTIFDGKLHKSLIKRNQWLKVALAKDENISALLIVVHSDDTANMATIKWGDQTKKSTLRSKINLIKLNSSRKVTSLIKIKLDNDLHISELMLFGWRRSEKIDLVFVCF